MVLDPNILALAERFGITIPPNLTRSAAIPIPSMTEVAVSKATVETREKAKKAKVKRTAAKAKQPTGGRLLTASGHPATAEQIEIN